MRVTTMHRTVSQEAAWLGIRTGLREASTLRVAVTLAVCDRDGHLTALARMDDAPLLSLQVAQDKAWTAVATRAATHDWWERIKDRPQMVHGLPGSRLMVWKGGIPIAAGRAIVGAVGVSGASGDEDLRIAKAVVATITSASK